MHNADNQAQSTHTHAKIAYIHADNAHVHADNALKQAENTDSDCAVYHAFAGIAGLEQADCKILVVRFTNIVHAQPRPVMLFAQTAYSQSIRGPPKLS